MSKQVQTQEEEIDFKRFNDFLNSINNFLFIKFKTFTLFNLKYKYIVISIIILGMLLGYLISKIKVYEHRIIINANYESIQYLYNQIDLIQSKIFENDKDFNNLNNLNLNEVISIEIEPIVNIRTLLNEINPEVLKMAMEDNNFNKFLTDKKNKKNYTQQIITLKTNDRLENDTLISNLLNFFNKNDFYNKIREIDISNINEKKVFNDSLIKQIDEIVSKIENTKQDNQKFTLDTKDNTIYDLLTYKEELEGGKSDYKFKLFINSEIIKPLSMVMNLSEEKSTLINVLKYSIIFYLLFLIIYSMSQFKNKIFEGGKKTIN